MYAFDKIFPSSAQYNIRVRKLIRSDIVKWVPRWLKAGPVSGMAAELVKDAKEVIRFEDRKTKERRKKGEERTKEERKEGGRDRRKGKEGRARERRERENSRRRTRSAGNSILHEG